MTFHTYIEILFVIVLWCVGFYSITRKGKIFSFLPYLTDWMPAIIKDPLTHCVVCFASVHSVLVYGFISWQQLLGVVNFDWRIWILLAIPTAFLNDLLWNIRTYFVKSNEKPF